jgi:UDP-N-acetylglucosamine diphosphorylase/glucosamine-1-phosphate N-acetyltransferase
MSLAVYLYDDPSDVPHFLPFTDSRPIGELRHGAWLLRERIAGAFGPVQGHVAPPHLAAFSEAGAPPVVSEPPADGARLVLRSTFLPAAAQDLATGFAPAGGGAVRLVDAGGGTVGAVLPTGRRWTGAAGLPADAPAVTLQGRRLEGSWELVGDLMPALRADLDEALADSGPGRVPAGCTVLGEAGLLRVDEGAAIEPLVVFDTRGGPIWVQAGAEVRTFSRLSGPLVVGAGTRIVGGQVRESSIGPMCVVHGEVSNCVFPGYANKSHDGFLGHSVVGRWVNLGAGTITSNLKNTYGPVRLNLGAARIETGLQFLGALIGDHVKTAIGTMLPTGSCIGTGANVFGTARPASLVPPFAWGTDEPGKVMACRMFLQVAARVLPRRHVAFDDAARRWLTDVWQHCTGQPCD